MPDRLSLVDRVIQRLSSGGDSIREIGDDDRDEDDLCDVCRRLDFRKIFSSKHKQRVNISLGRVSPKWYQECPLCRLTFRRLPPGSAIQSPEDGQPNQCFITAKAKDDHLQISYAGQYRGIIRKASFSGPEELRLDHASTLNYSSIISWLGECEAKHGENCNLREFATSRYRFPTDLNLIDTVEHRLIEGQSDLRYAALSYVWGGVCVLNTTTKNIRSLRRKGALSPAREDLPKIVQDAMRLLPKLGERYLWVDCLCIEQDSPQKHHDIARMDVIYTHAHFAIIALDGDNANVLLPGIRPRSRSPVRPVIRIRGQQLTSEPPSLESILKNTTYDTRGWTLQERALSRRRLYLSEQQTYFQCNVSVRSEFQPDEYNLKTSTTSRINDLRVRGSFGLDPALAESVSPGLMKRHWSDGLPLYQQLVEIYSTRKLSYAEDVVNAFSGFSSVFEECCGGAFVSGIPTATLSASLLWTSKAATTRRISHNGPSFATWSWAGWLGPITYRTTCNGEATLPSESLESEMNNLEVFVREKAFNYHSTKWINDLGQAVESDTIVKDVSLRDSSYFRLRHLSELRHLDGSVVSPEFRPMVETLRFSTRATSANSLTYLRMSSHLVVKLCARDHQEPCGVLFGAQGVNLEHVFADKLYWFILLSRDESTNAWQELVDFGIRAPQAQSKYTKNNGVFNIMLIRWKGMYSERVAIGKMFDDYWNSMEGGTTTVFLI